MRALALRCQLAPDRGTYYTVLIPLEKSEGKNELVGQNEMNQRREHIVNRLKSAQDDELRPRGRKTVS